MKNLDLEASTSSEEGLRFPAWGDVWFAGSLLVVAVLSGLYVDQARPDTVVPSTAWHWVLLGLPAVLVAFRRLSPIPILVMATLAQAIIWVTNLPEVLLPVVVILYTAASDSGETGFRASVASGVILTLVTAVGVQVADDVTVYQLPLVALTCGTAITLGRYARRQRILASRLAAQVATAQAASEYEQARAVADERTHIGRELHDIIGHSLSVIAVQAEAADRVADQQPDAARQAMSNIAVAARAALSETRRVLAGLQRSSVGELAPPPSLEETKRMVDALIATGVDIALDSQGCEDCPPSPVVAGSAHRIVQESLTNAIKHGGPDVKIAVSLVCTPSSLSIGVTNTVESDAQKSEDGSGLTGMAERIKVIGGEFAASMQPGGRFVVEAVLPYRGSSEWRGAAG